MHTYIHTYKRIKVYIQTYHFIRNRAQFVAEYCQETNDYRGAIEFLLIANKSDEAFKLAQSQSIVDVYTGRFLKSLFYF